MSVVRAIADEALRHLMVLGFADSEEEARDLLMFWAGASARATSSQGNRRYGVLFFKVVGGVLVGVQLDRDARHWCPQCLNTEIVVEADGSTSRCPSCSGIDKTIDP